MANIAFRHMIGNRIREQVGTELLKDHCEKLMRSALKRLETESVPLYRTRRGGGLVYNGNAIQVSDELHGKLAAFAKEADITLIDLCSSLAAWELKMTPEEITAEDIGLLPARRKLGLQNHQRR